MFFPFVLDIFRIHGKIKSAVLFATGWKKDEIHRKEHMQLADLAAYAKEKYQIAERRIWESFPGFSVLSDPTTGKWAALLIRQWDENAGEGIELCDLRGGNELASGFPFSFITKPFRMKGNGWIGVRFDESTDAKAVQILFDYAMTLARQPGYTVVLEDRAPAKSSAYQETPLPHPDPGQEKKRAPIPEQIHKMRRLFGYGAGYYYTDERKKFYLQGMFMKDYEDDQPWDGVVDSYYATYGLLNTKQLRGYFTWRTALRKGVFRPANDCFVSIYLNELLNQIGAESPRDSLQKMRDFEEKYVKTGCADEWFLKKMHRWMMEFAILYGLHPEEARQYADPAMLARDGTMAVLRSPEEHADEEVFSALLSVAKEKLTFSSVMLKSPKEGSVLFSKAWKHGCAETGLGGKNLFVQCFGEMAPFPWRPLAGSMYWERRKLDKIKYQLNACRIYLCSNGEWQVCSYETLYFDRDRFFGFLHETDRQLRVYLKTGHPLKEKAREAWAKPFVSAVIEEDRREKEEAAKPKIVLNLDGLEQIRRDALATRDSLLTDEEKREMAEAEETPAPPAPEISGAPAVPLDGIQLKMLRALLAGESADGIIREHRLLPSVAADGINEAFFEAIGDSIVEESNGSLTLMDDYADDVSRLLGGS